MELHPELKTWLERGNPLGRISYIGNTNDGAGRWLLTGFAKLDLSDFQAQIRRLYPGQGYHIYYTQSEEHAGNDLILDTCGSSNHDNKASWCTRACQGVLLYAIMCAVGWGVAVQLGYLP